MRDNIILETSRSHHDLWVNIFLPQVFQNTTAAIERFSSVLHFIGPIVSGRLCEIWLLFIRITLMFIKFAIYCLFLQFTHILCKVKDLLDSGLWFLRTSVSLFLWVFFWRIIFQEGRVKNPLCGYLRLFCKEVPSYDFRVLFLCGLKTTASFIRNN